MTEQEHRFADAVLSGYFTAIRSMSESDRVALVAGWMSAFSHSSLFGLNMNEKEFKVNFGKFVSLLVPGFVLGGHTVYAELEKHYGAVSVKFGMSHPAQAGHEHAAFETVLETLASEHNQFKLEGHTPQPGETNAPTRDTEVFLGERISVEVKEGKHYFKLHGGKYTKFGVRLWPEVAKRAGLESVPLTGLDLPPCDVTVEMQGGQPKRVLGIVWHNA